MNIIYIYVIVAIVVGVISMVIGKVIIYFYTRNPSVTRSKRLPPYNPHLQPIKEKVHVAGGVAFVLRCYRNGKGMEAWTIGRRWAHSVYFQNLDKSDYIEYDLPDFGGFEYLSIEPEGHIAFPNKADAESLLKVILEQVQEDSWEEVED